MKKTKIQIEETDDIIGDLHRIRAALLAEFNGDIHALTADAIKRQNASGRKVVDLSRGTLDLKPLRRVKTVTPKKGASTKKIA